jgi:hypothetical protein
MNRGRELQCWIKLLKRIKINQDFAVQVEGSTDFCNSFVCVCEMHTQKSSWWANNHHYCHHHHQHHWQNSPFCAIAFEDSARLVYSIVNCTIRFSLLWISRNPFYRPPLWSSGQGFWLQILRSRVWFPALPDFLRSSGSGTGSTHPREDNWGATWMEK